jgi:hypothetical protein
MTVRAKTGTGRIEHRPGKPKTTRRGNGKRGKPRAMRKLRRS